VILLSHWWLSHFWPLYRDSPQRLKQTLQRTASLPLGCGALAGTPYPVDRISAFLRHWLCRTGANSLMRSQSVISSQRPSSARLTGVHLSKLAEAIVLFSSADSASSSLPMPMPPAQA